MIDRVSLRTRSESDDATLRGLREEHIASDFAALPDELRASLVTTQRLVFEQGLKLCGPVHEWVIEFDGAPVGHLVVAERADEQRVVDILVAQAFRARGIGGAALRIALDRADNRGVRSRLQVQRSNPAANLYQRLGYVVTDSDELHFTMHRPTHSTL